MVSWKKYLVGLAAVGLVVTGVLYLKSAGSKSLPAEAPHPAFAAYVSAYSAGVLSSGSPIRIVLAQEVGGAGETDEKLFAFSPSLKGSTVWLDKYTVEFRPAERMRSGQTYEVTFELGKLVKVPDDLEEFTYSFRVLPQNFSLTVDHITPYAATDLRRQRVEGTLSTADFAPQESVERMLEAVQNEKSLKISWVHTPDGLHHQFTVEDVSRTEAASEVRLSAKGAPLEIDQEEEQRVEIPALGDFKVMNVRVEQGNNQSVVIQFSDPLNERQSLQGLVSISDIPALDFEIRGNEVKVFPSARQTGSKTLSLEPGIRNLLDYRMPSGGTFEVTFEQVAPAIRFVGKGTILPSSNGLVLPFEAVNLKAVDVRIIRVFEKNVLQFLQVNDLDGSSELRRVGKPLVRTKLSLEESGVRDYSKWTRFTLDLSRYIQPEPGAIYQVKLGLRRSYALYQCDQTEEAVTAEPIEEEEETEGEASAWDSYEDYYYTPGYEWEQRDNPCHVSYYTSSRSVQRNVVASDLGLLAKTGGDGAVNVFVTDIKTTTPVSGVELELYDYQQEVLAKASTDTEGKAILRSSQTPYVLVAKNGTQRGYLKLEDGSALSLSNFDVGGEKVSKGIKGLIYGERGVWRPGDSLFLTFLMEDRRKLLPDNHPVVMELLNPQGVVTQRMVKSQGQQGFYAFTMTTASDAPTGMWTARVKAGGTTFTQPVRIEMVKPNRLKINLDFGKDKFTASDDNISAELQVNWLQGSPGSNLKASFEMLMVPGTTNFAKYPEFVFDDPSREGGLETKNIFDGYTNASGQATIHASLEGLENPPSVLNAIFRGKVFEESGNFSIDRLSIPYYPYASYTGIRVPKGDRARGMLLTDTTHQVDIVTVDADGNPLSRQNLEVALYKMEWRWWWDNTDDRANYTTSDNAVPLASARVSTQNGKGSWNFRIKYPEWGRYLIRVRDPDSNHSTAQVVYVDWPGWAGRSRNEAQGASMLTFSSDKPAYQTGEKATLVVPGADQGRALVSIENGTSVLQSFWMETKKGDNPISFDITPEMTPNVYAHVTLLQPHAQTVNDLPLRMYGVIPIRVDDAATHLEPQIQMPDVLEPGQEVVIRVSEKSKRKMTYTLAVVEEGLLDLTRYKAPDAWAKFYAREALGVRTWDLFDEVMGSFGGKVERLLAIGGDAMASAKQDDARAKRFKPVVKFLGPFTTDGREQTHRFVMPSYIGSVKTMVVAASEGAYGTVEKATPVRKPLMVLATLPRVLGPGESVALPVTIFTMDKGIKNVKIDLRVKGPLTLKGASSQTVAMERDDMTSTFQLDVRNETGVAQIEVMATSGGVSSKDVIDIEIRNPNPAETRITEALLDNGKSWSGNVQPFGLPGTNTTLLEVSTLPPINLGQRLRYLMDYPHGCVEQTTSSVFAQLYLSQIRQLTQEEQQLTQRNVRAAIERLKTFVTADGGFGYWPGDQQSDSWGTIYAGHFLLEAEAKGYFVPGDMLKRWKKHERGRALDWRKHREPYSSELIQAYRMYVLALAGEPDMASMNRLRESGGLPPTAVWMLSAAYARSGQAELAKSAIANLPLTIKSYQEMNGSYGNDLRDRAVILETLLLLGDRTKAFELVKDLSQALSNPNVWMNTQTTSWCLKSIGQFAGGEKRGPLQFSYSQNGKKTPVTTDLPVAQINLPTDQAQAMQLAVESQTSGPLYVRVIAAGTPARGKEEEAMRNLTLNIRYTNLDGVPLDPSRLEQAQEFLAEVTITNPGVRGTYRNMALQQIFPSGWEITNLRLQDAEARLKTSRFTYQDVRDDRVNTYFDLEPGQQVTYRVLLTAAYAGTYYLPSVMAEPMYDHGIFARARGKVVEVVKPVLP